MKVGDVVFCLNQPRVPGKVIEVFDPPFEKKCTYYAGRVVKYQVRVKWLDGPETYEIDRNLVDLFTLIEYHRAQAEKYERLYTLVKPLPKRTIVIEVEGGVVQYVRDLPDGWDYEVVDNDDQQRYYSD